jgi:hypothetical protein
MKKAGRIILLITGILYVILGLAFAFIEARLLLSGDWQIYAHPTLGALSAAFRLLSALFFVASGVLAILFFFKKDQPQLLLYVEVFAVASFIIATLIASYLRKLPGPSPLYLVLPISFTADAYFVGAALLFLSSSREEKAPIATPEEKK